ncbi:MAG TPA: MFS transporter [Solirubrobacteraceae bacterium]|nr:MFS transporter [Solirubrobacteraceae bacterium]
MLAVLGMAQLMVVLDATIVNVALPSAQEALGFSDENRQWIVTAYALAFGSLLLLGGRLGDLIGRKRVFMVGLGGFAVASAIGGAAQSFEVLVASRALQGVFGALLAPAALSLLTTTFTDPAERGKAFGVFGAIAGSGAAVGLLLGGVLTEYLSWRWVMFVNLAFAAPAIFGALSLLHADTSTHRPRIDVPGTITATLGLFAIVYGFSEAERSSWTSGTTIAFLAAGVILLIVFTTLQRRVSHPLLPLRVVLDRDRGGSYLAVGISGAGMFGVFLFLTFFMQQNLGYTPVKTGLAFLPMCAAIMTVATVVTTNILGRTGPKPLIALGMVVSAAGMILLTGIGVDATYAADILPGLLLVGAGGGLVIAPGMASATYGVRPDDAGVASAMVNTAQQIGGSIGTALLSTVVTDAITGRLDGVQPSPQAVEAATIHGYTTAFWWAAAIFGIGAVVCGLLLKPGVQELDPSAAPAMAH